MQLTVNKTFCLCSVNSIVKSHNPPARLRTTQITRFRIRKKVARCATMAARGIQDPLPEPLDPQLDNSAEDVGNVVSFEHLNLEVPDLEVARLFFSEGLGLTVDPSRIGAQRGGMNVLWFNIGRQQFHICKGPKAQRLPTPGSAIGLVLPDLKAVLAQLEQLCEILGNVKVTQISQDTLEVFDPYGQCYMVHAQLPHFVADRGIAYVRLACFVNTAADIASFYKSKLGTPTRVHPANQEVRTIAQAEVRMGYPGTKLLFEESEELGNAFSEEDVLALFSGWHCAFYLANFSETYSKLRPLLFNSHPYKDKVHNFADARKWHQYRFQDIVRLVTDSEGEAATQLIYRISHECRSMAHPNFLRSLYNR